MESLSPCHEDNFSINVISEIGLAFFLSSLVFGLFVCQGFICQRLERNVLSDLALKACFFQLLSYLSSVGHSFHGSGVITSLVCKHLGHFGTFFAFCSQHFLYQGFTYVGFNVHYNAYLDHCLAGFKFVYSSALKWSFTALAFCLFAMELIDGNNAYFHLAVWMSTIYQLTAMSLCFSSFKEKKIHLGPNSLHHDAMVRAFQVAIGLNLFAAALLIPGWYRKTLQDASIGVSLAVFSMGVALIGEMNFMNGSRLPVTVFGDEESGVIVLDAKGELVFPQNNSEETRIEAGKETENRDLEMQVIAQSYPISDYVELTNVLEASIDTTPNDGNSTNMPQATPFSATSDIQQAVAATLSNEIDESNSNKMAKATATTDAYNSYQYSDSLGHIQQVIATKLSNEIDESNSNKIAEATATTDVYYDSYQHGGSFGQFSGTINESTNKIMLAPSYDHDGYFDELD
mmetsp:Transcript_9413/g.22862  ORF Transcript_9413/g.22862 Transcript_9413/m.22862 type:complete len:459 (+) Transcript_9413:124-1500(+)